VVDQLPINESGCRIWTGPTDKDGYAYQYISDYDSQIGGHRLVLQRSLGRPLQLGSMALHHCDTPGCVAEEHLYEGTHEQNMKDRMVRGRTARGEKFQGRKYCVGEKQHCSKLTEDDVREIRGIRSRNPEISQEKIGKMFGVTQTTVGHLLTGRTWTHVK